MEKLLIILIISIFSLTACQSKVEKDPIKEKQIIEEKSKEATKKIVEEDKKPEMVEDKKEEKEKEEEPEKVKIERVNKKEIDSNKYKYTYNDGNNSGELTSFIATKDLELKLIELGFKEELEEISLVKKFNLKKGEKILFNLVYPEGIPMLKLKWKINGKTDEFIFQFDGKSGNQDLIEYTY